jgi:signal peptidase I
VNWRSNLEAAVMAIVMALFLKQFVIEAYRIPTGSMQPTLMGDEQADIRDRVLVDKLSYALRAPERWEVAVFRYPLDRAKSFVKRIAGVGPEELRIQNGDVWRRAPGGEWSIARRPENVMREQWKRLDADELTAWVPQHLPLSSRWNAEGSTITARGSGTASFRGGREPILDGYFDGYPPALAEWFPPHPRDSAQNPVGDLRVEGKVRALHGLERFQIVLREGRRAYRFEFPGPAAPESARARIDAGPSALVTNDERPEVLTRRLPAEREVHFAAQNLDDELRLSLDGEDVLVLQIEPAQEQVASITLELEGEGAELSDLTVYRDVFYTARSPEPIAIPDGCYYMLGDNTQDSSDSREWTFVTYEVRGADGTPTRLRGNWRERENPRSVAYGEPGGPLTYLVDEWGERHWLRREDVQRPRATELAPFVPRALIQGKALAVFWPWQPSRGIWRLKWVN